LKKNLSIPQHFHIFKIFSSIRNRATKLVEITFYENCIKNLSMKTQLKTMGYLKEQNWAQTTHSTDEILRI